MNNSKRKTRKVLKEEPEIIKNPKIVETQTERKESQNLKTPEIEVEKSAMEN